MPDETFDLGIEHGDDAETLAAKALAVARKRGSVDRANWPGASITLPMGAARAAHVEVSSGELSKKVL